MELIGWVPSCMRRDERVSDNQTKSLHLWKAFTDKGPIKSILLTLKWAGLLLVWHWNRDVFDLGNKQRHQWRGGSLATGNSSLFICLVCFISTFACLYSYVVSYYQFHFRSLLDRLIRQAQTVTCIAFDQSSIESIGVNIYSVLIKYIGMRVNSCKIHLSLFMNQGSF